MGSRNNRSRSVAASADNEFQDITFNRQGAVTSEKELYDYNGNLYYGSTKLVSNTSGNVIIDGNVVINGNITIDGTSFHNGNEYFTNVIVSEQIFNATGSAAHPSYTFSEDQSSGIYKLAVDQVGFSASGSLKAALTISNFSLIGGDATTPSMNFGLEDTDTNTGMYRIAGDTLGFSVGGVQKVGVYSADSGDFIHGLNIGTTGNIAGIKRLSATAANSWEDGHMGDSTQLFFAPGDFSNFNIRNSIPEIGGITKASVSFPGATGYVQGLVVTSTTGNLVGAVKLLPKGFFIPSGRPVSVYVNTPGGPGGNPSWAPTLGNFATLEVFTQDLSTPTIVPDSLQGAANMTSWGIGGVNTQYLTNTNSPTGNGTISVVIDINITGGAGLQITDDDALCGVSVPMQRI